MMQMRKCCNHPYLFEAPVDADGDWVIDDRLIECSGKMKLLDSMLRVRLVQSALHAAFAAC
jgi:ATP-dependent DNA helicase